MQATVDYRDQILREVLAELSRLADDLELVAMEGADLISASALENERGLS